MVEEVCFDVCFEEDAPSVWEYRRRVAWPNTLLLVSLRGPSYSTVVFLLVVGKAVQCLWLLFYCVVICNHLCVF